MNIALIGEFSSLQAMLALGFREHGIEACVFANGDGFKKIGYDVFFGKKINGYLGLARYLFFDQPSMLKNIFSDYDVVQIVNPYAFLTPNHGRVLYSKYLLSNVVRKDKDGLFSLLVAGCDSNVMLQVEAQSNRPCEGCLKDTGLDRCAFSQPSRKQYEDYLVERLDVILPFGGEAYANAYSRAVSPMPFPMAVSAYDKKNTVVNNKIRVLHGINRPGFKGSELILKAFNRLENDYPGVFDFLVPNRLPLNDYLELMMSANVVVDQMPADCFGMNSLFAMSHGKVVLTSCDLDYMSTLYGENPPLYSIDGEESLYEKLKYLMSWDSLQFEKIGEEARRFIEQRCDPATVAGEVLKIYKNMIA